MRQPQCHTIILISKSPYFMPSFEQDHFFLLDLSTILEPQTSYRFDYTFGSIDEEIANTTKEENEWNEYDNGPTPVELDDITHWHWYTQYLSTCALLRQSANLNGLEFREICDYVFQDDETIYTGHHLDLY